MFPGSFSCHRGALQWLGDGAALIGGAFCELSTQSRSRSDVDSIGLHLCVICPEAKSASLMADLSLPAAIPLLAHSTYSPFTQFSVHVDGALPRLCQAKICDPVVVRMSIGVVDDAVRPCLVDIQPRKSVSVAGFALDEDAPRAFLREGPRHLPKLPGPGPSKNSTVRIVIQEGQEALMCNWGRGHLLYVSDGDMRRKPGVFN